MSEPLTSNESGTLPRPPKRANCRKAAVASAARIEANRRNARKSTGPRTAAGKAVCARNAVKHGFRSSNPVFTEEERNELNHLIALFRGEHQPVNQAEEDAVLRLAIGVWNLDRIAVLEFAAYQGDAEGPGVIATVRNIHALSRYRAAAEQSFHTALREILHLRRSRRPERNQTKICTNRPNIAPTTRNEFVFTCVLTAAPTGIPRAKNAPKTLFTQWRE